MRAYSIIFFFLIMLVISCKSYYTNIGDKKANYIPYYLKVYEADSLYLTNNFQRSYEILDSLFKKYEPIDMENYNEYSTYIITSALTGHTDSIDIKFKKIVSDFGGIGISHPDRESIFTKVDSVFNINGITKEKFIAYKEEYTKKINLELRKRIKKMLIEDQSVRTNYDQKGMDFFQEKHRIEIEDIISKYGYPNYKVIGTMGFYQNESDESFGPISFKTIFLHQSEQMKAKYLPMLFYNLKNGKCLPEEYASIYDKKMWGETAKMNKPMQLYGSFSDVVLADSLKINSLRKSIGLPSLEYEKWRNNKVL